MSDRIIITKWSISEAFDYPDTIKNDPKLIKAIKRHYKNELAPKNIELFERRNNVIATDSGTYGAFYESQLKKSNTPYK